jgi:hypothetical protein
MTVIDRRTASGAQASAAWACEESSSSATTIQRSGVRWVLSELAARGSH